MFIFFNTVVGYFSLAPNQFQSVIPEVDIYRKKNESDVYRIASREGNCMPTIISTYLFDHEQSYTYEHQYKLLLGLAARLLVGMTLLQIL